MTANHAELVSFQRGPNDIAVTRLLTDEEANTEPGPERLTAGAAWLRAAMALRDADQETEDAQAALLACQVNSARKRAEAEAAFAAFEQSHR